MQAGECELPCGETLSLVTTCDAKGTDMVLQTSPSGLTCFFFVEENLGQRVLVSFPASTSS